MDLSSTDEVIMRTAQPFMNVERRREVFKVLDTRLTGIEMAQILLVDGLFIWNLSRNVGRNQPNNLDDVELVRFGYACVGRNGRFPASAALVGPISQMRSSGIYGDDLQTVIDAHQQDRGGTQDGAISVMDQGAQINQRTYDGVHSWIISVLNNNMIDVIGDFFPRIDKADFSGPQISAVVKKLLRLT